MIKSILILSLIVVCLFQLTTEQDSDVEARALKKRKKKPPAKADDTDEAKPAPPLTPENIEFSKKWWKNLGEQQKEAVGGDGGTSGTGQQKKKRKKKPKTFAATGGRAVRPSGDWQFLDSVAATLFPIGDPYTGVPDGIFDFARYCIDFIIQGFIFLAYTTARWPHKVLLKTMIGIGVVSHLATNTMFCANPLSAYNFIRKGAMVNEKMDELTENTNLWKKRLANSIDRFPSMINIQKHSCCAYWEWKRKSVEIVPKGAKDFVFQWFTAFYKIHEVVYCQKLTMEQFRKWCVDYEFMDMQPVRVLPRSMITLCVELFTKFF